MMRAALTIAVLILAGCEDQVEQPSFVETTYIEPILSIDVDLGNHERDARYVGEAGAALRVLSASELARIARGRRIDTVHVNFLGGPLSQEGVGRKIIHGSYSPTELKEAIAVGYDNDQLLAEGRNLGSWGTVNDDIVGPYCRASQPSPTCAMLD